MLLTLDENTRRFVPLEGDARGIVHAASPTEVEQRLLEAKLGVPRAMLAHALDADEIARITTVGDAELLVLRMPIEDPQHPGSFTIVPLGVALLTARVVTISLAPPDAVSAVLQGCEVDVKRPMRGILGILFAVTDRYLEIVRRIERDMERLEDELSASLRNREVLGLLALQKTLIKLATALRSNEVLLQRLRHDARCKVSPAEQDLLRDVRVELQQAIEMTTVRANELASMMDAFASLISNNLNVVMKVLTSLAIVLTVPMLIASFYGMNVPLPMQKEPWAFAFVTGLSLVASGGLVAVFRRRKWL